MLRRLPKKLIVISAVGSLVVTGAIVAIAGLSMTPPAKRLAELAIESGKPFSLQLTSDGEAIQVWLTMECDSCSFPVTGKIAVLSNGKTIAANEVEAGDSRDRAWGGTHRTLTDLPFFDTPAVPAGNVLSVRGVLSVGRAKGNWSNEPLRDAPPPRVKTFHLFVTH